MPPKVQTPLIQAGQPLRRDFPDPDAAGSSPSGPINGQCENELGVAKDGLENRASCQAAVPLAPGSRWSLLGGAAVDRDPGVGDTFQYAAGIGYSGPKLTSQLQAGVFALPLTWNQPRSPVIDWNTQYRFNPTTEAHVGLAAATNGGATELNVGASHDFFKSETFDLLASAEYQRVSGREDVPLGSPQRVIATVTPTFQLNPQWSLELNARVNAGVGNSAANTVVQGGAKVTYSPTERLNLSAAIHNMDGPLDIPGDPAAARRIGVGLGAEYELSNGMKIGLETKASGRDAQAALTLTIPFGGPSKKR